MPVKMSLSSVPAPRILYLTFQVGSVLILIALSNGDNGGFFSVSLDSWHCETSGVTKDIFTDIIVASHNMQSEN